MPLKQTDLKRNLMAAFSSYGGWRTMLASGYFRVSVAISVLLWRTYSSGEWASQAVSSLPTVLGFTLASAAVLTSVGGEGFRERLALVNKGTDEPAPIKEVITDFVIVIVIQVGAYLFSTVFLAKPIPVLVTCFLSLTQAQQISTANFLFGAVGAAWFVYSITLTLGLAFSLLSVVDLYVRDVRRRAN